MARLLLLAPCLLIAACFPAHRTAQTQTLITVVDAQNHRRIPNARVVVETWREYAPDGGKYQQLAVVNSLTDSRGQLKIPGVAEWQFLQAGGVKPRFNRRICISADGFRHLELDPWKENPRGAFINDLKSSYGLTASLGVDPFVCAPQ